MMIQALAETHLAIMTQLCNACSLEGMLTMRTVLSAWLTT